MASSTDFLVDHALENVWARPGADRQHIIRPARISNRRGEIGSMRIGMRMYTLPSRSDTYHVFSIGDVIPTHLGMDEVVDTWVSARAHAVSTSLLVDVYDERGVRYPTSLVYFLYTRMGGLHVAIKHQHDLMNFGLLNPFIRWRSSLYFDGVNVNGKYNNGVEIEYVKATDESSIYQFQLKWQQAKGKPGKAFAYVNGRRVKEINLVTCKLGDHLEFVRDGSIKEIVEFPLSTLPSFTSTLDQKSKYLLLRHGVGEHIDFEDDVDIHILNYTKVAAYDGIYYHRNRKDSIRMVTHRDYAIPTDYVDWYLQTHTGWSTAPDIRLEVIVRHSGLERPIADDSSRIKELFKLSDDARQNAMIGENAGVAFWRAEALESSAYVRMMSMRAEEITRSVVQESYGYNAVAKLVGDLPIKLNPGEKWVRLPRNTVRKSTVFEYNANGIMTGWYVHDSAIEYPIRNPTTRYIEAIPGEGALSVSTIYDASDYRLDPTVDYRFYVCDAVNGVPSNNWRDVTGDAVYYTIDPDRYVRWNVDPSHYKTAIRNSLDFLCYSLELDYRDGLMAFTVQSSEIQLGHVPIAGTYDIPPGQLDLFLNGAELVENVDYFVHWPEICIVNKEHLTHVGLQQIVIRGRGFCSAEMDREEVGDWGFVKRGRISQNGRFNIRDDKVSKVSIGGRLYLTSEIKFTEDGELVTTTPLDGQPYQVKHPYIPLLDVIDGDDYSFRDQAIARDKVVEDYMTLYAPESPIDYPVPIQRHWQVFSPFTTKLIYDMLNGILTMDEFKGEYSLEYVRNRLHGYTWILDYDPALLGVDEDFVEVLPHPEPDPIQLTIYQYRLLHRAIQVFLNGNVSLIRDNVVIEPGYEHEQEGHTHPNVNAGM